MGCDTYSVMIDNIVVAKGMSIEHAVIFVKAVYNERAWITDKKK